MNKSIYLCVTNNERKQNLTANITAQIKNNMKKTEFKKLAKENGYNIYSIKTIREKGCKGYLIVWSKQLNTTTTTTENERVFWEESLEDVLVMYFSR